MREERHLVSEKSNFFMKNRVFSYYPMGIIAIMYLQMPREKKKKLIVMKSTVKNSIASPLRILRKTVLIEN
jgi:hypothetical protein